MNWNLFLPPDKDVQCSKSTDYEACASYSFIYILEMQLKAKTGYFWEWCERFTAKTTDTQPWGNSLDNVVKGVNEYGVCLVEDYPELTYSTDYENIDWKTYYATIPRTVLQKAYPVQASYRKLATSEISHALQTSPLWTIVKTSSGQSHCVAQISETQFYDSYEIKIKNFSDGYPIQSQYLLTINITQMPNAEFVHKTGTQEYGFYLPALTPDALKDKALNFGLPLLDQDGNIDFTKAKEVQGL
jgi:hypothetical protein